MVVFTVFSLLCRSSNMVIKWVLFVPERSFWLTVLMSNYDDGEFPKNCQAKGELDCGVIGPSVVVVDLISKDIKSIFNSHVGVMTRRTQVDNFDDRIYELPTNSVLVSEMFAQNCFCCLVAVRFQRYKDIKRATKKKWRSGWSLVKWWQQVVNRGVLTSGCLILRFYWPRASISELDPIFERWLVINVYQMVHFSKTKQEPVRYVAWVLLYLVISVLCKVGPERRLYFCVSIGTWYIRANLVGV